MTEALSKFKVHMAQGDACLDNFDERSDEFALRYVWINCVSAFDLYMTELVSEAGLRLIDKNPMVLTANLKQIGVPLEKVFGINDLSPAEKMIFYRDQIFSAVQYTSFYKPDKISVALSYIWTTPAKEKWKRIFSRMSATGRYEGKTESYVRDELELIGDRRDIIAHSVDTPPGRSTPNPVNRGDAVRVIEFLGDAADAIDAETEEQLSS
ncbi:hypothetical protein [Sulfitobacter pontiacus]|uniref:hypothetical protein n=1 Tax=Sulfitobacter pontiacus TaxID=60137 RepID=UPI0030EC5D7E